MSINTTITNNQQPIRVEGFPDRIVSMTGGLNTQANALMNVTAFRNQFPTMDGRGYSVAVIDTGINTNHPAFAGRIVAQKDFGDNDDDATDVNGHGTNVSSIIGSSNSSYLGVAPGVNIIALKVFTNSGSGTMSRVERALRWVIDNAATHNIVSINMSISDGMNHNTNTSLYGLNDELDILANQLGIVPVSAAGNSFYPYNSQQGIAYPASDRNSLAVGAVFDRNVGRLATGSGAIAETSGPDITAPFSQRHQNLTTVMAPGVQILGAAKTTSTGVNTATSVYTGTSQASPQIAAIIALAQQFAGQTLGRRLTYDEIIGLLQNSGRTINDGDDENDNVTNTGLNFKRVDMMALAQSIQNLTPNRLLKIAVNLSDVTPQLQEYGRGLGIATVTNYSTNIVTPNRTELNITGNTWLQVPLNYTITPNTLLSFDFKSNNTGDIHGIGFDTDTSYATTDAQRAFQLSGATTWGRNNYQYTTPGNWQTFTIRAGKFFTGQFNHLFFTNRHNVSNPTATSSYNNIRIYERSFPNLNINVNGTNNIRQMQEYGNNQEVATITDYNAVTVTPNQTELNITGNTWLQVPLNYTVTPNTLLSFDFKSSIKGGIHGIGFDTDTSYSYTDANRAVKLDGTEWWGRNNYQYTTTGNWQSFTIRAGKIFTGQFNHLLFANRHNVTTPTATSSYNNIRIYERSFPNLNINVNGVNNIRQMQEYGNNLNGATITDYSAVTTGTNQTELNITGNTWLQIPLSYTVTPNTLLSFDFKSTSQGGIHGLGFDTDTSYANTDINQAVKLHGTEWWGRNNYRYTTPGNWQSFTIPAGKIFTGQFNHLFFTNRHDVTTPTATSSYNNIRIYERSLPNLNINVNGVNNIGQMQEYGNNLNGAIITDYNAVTTGTNQTELNITGNTWLQVPLNYTVTPNTLLSFDFKSTIKGGIHGLGFDTDTSYANTDVNQGLKLYGTEWWGTNSYQYTNSTGNWQSFEIPVGRVFTGQFNHLFFANRHNVTAPNATSSYNNIRVFERPSPNLTIRVNGSNSSKKVQEYGLSQSVATISNYTTTVENDTLLNITGNSWLQIPLNYRVTPNTLLKFDFKSNNRGNIHGIGFDTNTTYTNTDANQGFKLYGTEWWGRNNYQYTNVGNWQSFQIRVGTFFTGEFNNLFFANRHSLATPTATSQFRGIEIMEQIP